MTVAAIDAADLCLIPARPSPADIEASAPTLATIRASDKPFAFVLNQTPVRSFRLTNAAASLNDTATALNASSVLALPYIVLRNDQQDALGAGLPSPNTRSAASRRTRSAASGSGSGAGSPWRPPTLRRNCMASPRRPMRRRYCRSPARAASPGGGLWADLLSSA